MTASEGNSASDEVELGGMFAEKAESKGGMGMAMIAGLAGVVIVIAVVGWLMMSSGKSTPEVRPTAAPPVAQIPPTEPQQSASTSTASAPESPAQPESEAPSPLTAAATRNAAQPVAAKAKKDEKEAPKAAEKKKSVTVDDLINDN
jgi:hypothetical protein